MEYDRLIWHREHNDYFAYGEEYVHKIAKKGKRYQIFPNKAKDGYQDWFSELWRAKRECQRREYGVALPMDAAFALEGKQRP